VSADGEVKLYSACIAAGITLLSIGHRPALRQFHSRIVHFNGMQEGPGWSLEEVDHRAADKPLAPSLSNC
jgi:ABC-type uncharacterized transport system fused permease/ATPase subunit